jgi:hypothetical protein
MGVGAARKSIGEVETEAGMGKSLHACYFLKAGSLNSAHLELINDILPNGGAGG